MDIHKEVFFRVAVKWCNDQVPSGRVWDTIVALGIFLDAAINFANVYV